VEGATKITVALFSEADADDREYGAKIIGRDPLTDSALIQLTELPDRALEEAKFGDSSQMQPGDWVMAIGNPFGLAHTVTVGVVSANRPGGMEVADRRFQDVLQTDAAINPGNSGGPLLNLRGEVVAINTAILSRSPTAGNVGIGFAIPINIIRDLLPQLRTGKVTRGRIGVLVGPVTSNDLKALGLKTRRGAVVSTVEAGGPAAKSGMEPGDVIIEYNGKPVPTRDELIRMVTATRPGTTVPVKVLRNGQERSLSVTIEELDLEAESSQARRGTETEASAGFGIRLNDVTPDIARRLRLPSGTTGAVITDVAQASSAARAGLQVGDVVLEVNRQPVSSATEASRLLGEVRSGDSAGLLIWRDGQRQFVLVRKE
jgi:serine protease Do